MAVDRSRRARAARRRTRRVAAADNDLTDEQWVAIREAWGGCAYCGASGDDPGGVAPQKSGVALQKDCVLPISRGGRYTLTNVVPACRSCNASKCNSETTAWLRRKRLDEQAFLLRRHRILGALAPVDTPGPDTSLPDPSLPDVSLPAHP